VESRAAWALLYDQSLLMVFISLSACRLTKYLSSLFFCIGLVSIPCRAQTVFFAVRSTPYDRQMNRVSMVLRSNSLNRVGRVGPLSLMYVNEWLTNLRAIPYQYSKQWKTPAEVNSAMAGDCKGKAVMLYARMRANGATHVRFVIGKHHVSDLKTHAWLEWDTTNGTYLLDPTFNWAVTRADENDPMTYIAFYAYDGPRKYRAGYHRSSYPTAVAQN
jgi:predicted transglutaminase-like cysteine proteinase